MFGKIGRQQPQQHCLPLYRGVLAVQPFGNLRRRIRRPQRNEFAEFLIGPAGHDRPRSRRPSAWCHARRFVRHYFGDCIFYAAPGLQLIDSNRRCRRTPTTRLISLCEQWAYQPRCYQPRCPMLSDEAFCGEGENPLKACLVRRSNRGVIDEVLITRQLA